MRPATYPFAAIVGQEQMKLALLLAAVDWRLGVLLRGDKGSGKTTTARGLAALLPSPAPFVNLPIGSTEDRLLGGLHVERALQGDAVLKPGLLSQAHGGVLYVDEINLLPAHLGDALLDTAASGVNVVEREGLSASHAAEFVLLGSMNPEEGSLRPQLLDRFALSVDINASMDPAERQLVVERRMSFERQPERFAEEWAADQQRLKEQVLSARAALNGVHCSAETLLHISETVCEAGVRSMRADLAIMRAAAAYAALAGDLQIELHHVATILPLVLAHRARERSRQTPPPPPQQQPESQAPSPKDAAQESLERIFAPQSFEAPSMRVAAAEAERKGLGTATPLGDRGPVVRARLSKEPTELDLRATLNHSLLENGTVRPQLSNLHERVRRPKTGTRYLFVIDSSGSHAAQERMRVVKGAVSGLLTRSLKREDEVAILIFRGTSAQVILEPTTVLADAISALEYLPTGGRTPLAHALQLAQQYVTSSTLLVLLTDGRANVPLQEGDPWEDALAAARNLSCAALVIDTEDGANAFGQTRKLAEVLRARCLRLDELAMMDDLTIEMNRAEHNVPAR